MHQSGGGWGFDLCAVLVLESMSGAPGAETKLVDGLAESLFLGGDCLVLGRGMGVIIAHGWTGRLGHCAASPSIMSGLNCNILRRRTRIHGKDLQFEVERFDL